MTTKNPFVSTCELTAFRGSRAFLNGDNDELLKAFNALIQENLNKSSYQIALINLWSALSICEQATDHAQVKQTLNHTLNLSPFIHDVDDYAILMESIITNFFDTNKEITSTAYFILSVLCMNNRLLDRSHKYANMAHIYALQLNKGKNQPYLRNAQLQLIFPQLLRKDWKKVDYYIEQFGWHIENCRNNEQKMLLQTIAVMKNAILGKITDNELLLYIEKLASSDGNFYPLYLMMQLNNIVYVTDTPKTFHKVSAFYNSLRSQICSISDVAFNDYYFLRNRFITNSNLFFTRAEQLLKQTKAVHSEICLLHLTDVELNLSSVYDFILHTFEEDFIFFPLHHNEFLIAFDLQLKKRLQHTLTQHIENYDVLLEVSSTSEVSRFIELYIIYTQQLAHKAEH